MKYIPYIIAALVILVVTAVALRIISGEDSWDCENGKWIKHGNPSAEQPMEICE
jgi:L-lactate permease